MNLNELKAIIDNLVESGNGELKVIMSSDDEGNGFRPLDSVQVSMCTDGYDGHPVHPDDVGESYDLEDLSKKVVLW